MILRASKALIAASSLFLATAALFFAAGAQAQTAPEPKAAPASASVPVPAAITPNGTVVEDVIARVNDQIITRSDVERAQTEFDQQSQSQALSPADVAEHQQNLLRDLIDQQLLLSKGKELDINADAQVITQLDEIRKENHFATMEDLEKAAQQQGVSFEDFKANIRNNLITQQVVRDEVGRRLQFTHADAVKYYNDHKADFTQQESVTLSEILIATSAPDGQLPDDATVAAAKAKADDVAAKLKAGASFNELAKKMSNGPTAAQGGDLGEFKRGALAPALEEKTFVLPAGSVTDPIRTRQGFVLLKVTAHTPGGVQPLSAVEDQVEQAVYMQQMQPALRAYLTQLREDAYIDIKPGFVDTGASAKQTKPIFTAYAPPVAKKKTVEAKKRFDRHGRVVEASATVAAPAAAPSTAAATTAPGRLSAKKISSKPRHERREKVRFGQAPRETLPSVPGPQVAALPTQVGSAQGTAGLVSEAMPDPNAIGSPDTTQDPLGPHAAQKTKTRYAQHPEAPKKPKPKPAPIAAAPPTEEESATEKTQAAPLGLNGDTSKKKKAKGTKHKGPKGPKERIEQKTPPPAAPPVSPSAMPSLTTPPNAIPPAAQPPVATPSGTTSDAPPTP
jgi:peptidyl-prolyl cis-trans isomerase SurA